MDVSVIIVNYNTLGLTRECIDSIVEKTQGITYEIILVDNASTDGSKEFFENEKRVRYIYSERNGGFGYGNNLGMKVAKGEYFLLLNSDTLLINNAIKDFYDYAAGEKAVYGCYLRGEDYNYACSFFYFPAFTICDFIKRICHIKRILPVDYQPREVEAISGADMFFHREIFEKTGGFDENIFMYGEEGEWQYRIQALGYKSYITPIPKIQHLEGKSSRPSITKEMKSLRSHFYIQKKHMKKTTYFLARIYYALNLGGRKINYVFNKEGRKYLYQLISKV